MRAEQPRVVVTGLGATTPLGGDVATTWESMLAGRSGARALTEDWAAELPARIAAPAVAGSTTAGAAILAGSSAAQSSVRARAPLRPASIDSHVVATSPPRGVVAPRPVTTTRGCSARTVRLLSLRCGSGPPLAR